jgi:threonine synthase
MQYLSLNRQSPAVDFREAAIRGQAPDKGLYFPESIPLQPRDFIENIEEYSKEEIAFMVIQPYIGTEIPEEKLRQIVSETLQFDFPLVQVTEDMYSLELFHGPTMAFKDVGARFMSRCLGHFIQNKDQELTVLVATSGDTGGAVASGFLGVEGVKVVILYPSGKVSNVQELQLTTLGQNIKALEVNGNFDDCQEMVKKAFADESLNKIMFITSANSINIARWLPQQFYYWFAWKAWPDKKNPPVFCVPSGNFGNICAGLLSYQSGLPANHFIAACNANNTVTDYLINGNYRPKQAVPTISNAMDVGDPSNFVRILELFNHYYPALKEALSGYSITDEQTMQTIFEVFNENNYLLDPHGAVAFQALKAGQPFAKGIFLETAHPVKFPETVESIINWKVPVPQPVYDLLLKKKNSIRIEADYSALRDFLLETI